MTITRGKISLMDYEIKTYDDRLYFFNNLDHLQPAVVRRWSCLENCSDLYLFNRSTVCWFKISYLKGLKENKLSFTFLAFLINLLQPSIRFMSLAIIFYPSCLIFLPKMGFVLSSRLLLKMTLLINSSSFRGDLIAFQTFCPWIRPNFMKSAVISLFLSIGAKLYDRERSFMLGLWIDVISESIIF